MPPDLSNPMRYWRRNTWLIGILVGLLLTAVLALAYLAVQVIRKSDALQQSNRAKNVAISQLKALRTERDGLIKAAAAAPDGSSRQAAILSQLEQTTSRVLPGVPGAAGIAGSNGANGLNGLPGLTGLSGRDGRAGQPGQMGAVGNEGPPGPAGPSGASGATGATGPEGQPGPAGPQGSPGPQGDRPRSFTFTSSDGTTYDCRPSNDDGDYACTPRSQPVPSPVPTP